MIAILLQVPLSAGAETVPGAGRHMLRAALSFALMCGTLIAASWAPSALAAALMVMSVVLHTLGEIWHSSGGWGLQFALSPDAERGNYAAAYSLGPTAVGMVGPSLIAGGVVAAGSVGWAALALLFLAAGLGARSVARRAVPLTAAYAAPVGATAEVSSPADRRAEPAGTDDDPAIPR